MFPTPHMRRLQSRSFAAALALLTHTVWAVPESQFQPAFAQFVQAAAGDTAMIEPAAQSFDRLLQAEPDNPVLMAYAGSTRAMKASTTWFPWKKMSHAEDGMAQLDKALALLRPHHNTPVQNATPGVLEVKFVAANTFLAVPGFMNRRERGNRLLGDVAHSPLLTSAPLGFRGSVWIKAAEEAIKDKRADEARRLLNLAVQQQTPQRARAESLLKALSL